MKRGISLQALGLGSLLLLGLAASAGTSLAQDTPPALPTPESVPPGMCPCPEPLKHVLGGHNFMPSLSIGTPFPDTETNLGVAGSVGTYPTSLGLAEDLKLGSIAPSLSVQVALLSRLAVSAGVSARGVTGINTNSALIYGASVTTQWNLGAIFSLIETDRLILSLGFNVILPHFLSVSPTQAIPELNAVLASATPEYSSSNVDAQYQPTLRFAYAFNPTLGLLALGGLKFDNLAQDNTGLATSHLILGLGAQADLKPSLKIPFGLTANVFRSQILQSSDFNSMLYSFGLYETSWTQASIGVEVGFSNNSGVDSTLGAVVTRIYY